MNVKNIIYREVMLEECTPTLFAGFDRYQEVTHCWRKEDGNWLIKDISFVEQWGEKNFAELAVRLQRTLQAGGKVFAAFLEGRLLAFASLKGSLFGTQKQYLQLSEMHTSCESRRMGIGKQLFRFVCTAAKEMGAQKLYLSAHSSRETQAFYHAMGCVEAEEYDSKLTAKEPCDCQMECVLEHF